MYNILINDNFTFCPFPYSMPPVHVLIISQHFLILVYTCTSDIDAIMMYLQIRNL